MPARIEEIGPASQRILEVLGVPDDIDFLVAVREALANAVLHGCKANAALSVVCTAEEDNDDLLVTIRDPGAGFDHLHGADPTTKEGIVKFSGRGLLLIRHGADEVTFSNGGATIQIRKSRKVHARSRFGNVGNLRQPPD